MKSPNWSSLNTGRFILKGHAKCMLQVFLWQTIFECLMQCLVCYC